MIIRKNLFPKVEKIFTVKCHNQEQDLYINQRNKNSMKRMISLYIRLNNRLQDKDLMSN